MNELQIFNNPEFGSVRTITKDGKTYFVGNDVAKALGYSETAKAIRTHCKGVSEMDIPTNGGVQTMKMITEGDIYRLVIKSQLPQAEKFESWVFDNVLPSIRKNGGYISNQEQMTPEQIVANALIVAQNIISKKDKQIEELETSVQQMDAVITEMTPKVDYADRILSSKDCMTVSQIAQDYGMSAKRFNKILNAAGIQRKVGDQWILYAEYQGKGYVRNKTCEYSKGNGDTGTKLLTVWTQKGRMLIYEELKRIGVFPQMENAS